MYSLIEIKNAAYYYKMYIDFNERKDDHIKNIIMYNTRTDTIWHTTEEVRDTLLSDLSGDHVLCNPKDYNFTNYRLVMKALKEQHKGCKIEKEF